MTQKIVRLLLNLNRQKQMTIRSFVQKLLCKKKVTYIR